MKRVSLALVALACAAALGVGGASAATYPVWVAPTSGSQYPSTIASPQASGFAWSDMTCKLGYQVWFRSLTATGLGPAKALSTCTPKVFTTVSAPVVTYNTVTKKLYVVWAGRSQQTGLTTIYFRASSDNGKTFGKQISLAKLRNQVEPPVIAAASYAARLWVMWTSWTPTSGQHRPLHLQAFDPRFGNALSPVLGLDRFNVLPTQGAMKIFPSKDGVVAFWQDFNNSTLSWQVADTERVSDSPTFKVQFVYRGPVGAQATNHIFVGEDGKVYRLVETLDKSDILHEQVVYTLDQWAFASHGFVPAYPAAAEPVAVLPGSYTVHSWTVAANVTAAHQLILVTADPTTKATCYFNNSPLACVISTGVQGKETLDVTEHSPDGSTSSGILTLGLGPATGNEAFGFSTYFDTSENVITSRFGSPRLFIGGQYGVPLDYTPGTNFALVPANKSTSAYTWVGLPPLTPQQP